MAKELAVSVDKMMEIQPTAYVEYDGKHPANEQESG